MRNNEHNATDPIELIHQHWELSLNQHPSVDEIQQKNEILGDLAKSQNGTTLAKFFNRRDQYALFLQGWCYEQGLCSKKISLNTASYKYGVSEKSHIGAAYQLGRIYMMESSGFAASTSTSIKYFEQTIELSKDSKQLQKITPEILKKIQRESYYALHFHHLYKDTKLAREYRDKAKALGHPELTEDQNELLSVKAKLDEKNQAIKEKNSELHNIQEKFDQIETELQSKVSEINNLNSTVQTLEGTIKENKQPITEKSDELQAIRDELDKVEPNLILQGSTASSLDTNNNNANLTTRIRALGEIIEAKTNEADSAKSENEKAQETVQNQTAELERLSDLERKLAEKQEEIAELNPKLQEKEAETSESSKSNDRSSSKNRANSPGFFKEEERGREREHARGRRKKRRRSQPQPSQDDIEKILRLVAEGEQDKAEKLLKRHPELALCKGTVTDLSGRIFKSITVFQYALWALDWHMWEMIRKYLADADQAKQFADWENNGTYLEKDGTMKHEKHADWTPLIKALEEYRRLIEENASYDAREKCWCEQVGGHQRQLPAHAVNEYCRKDRSFHPIPKFEEKKLPRTRKTGSGEWFTAIYNGGKLGEDWGVMRGAYIYGSIACTDPEAVTDFNDMGALYTLHSIRVKQRSKLAKRLYLRLSTEAADGAGPSQPALRMS